VFRLIETAAETVVVVVVTHLMVDVDRVLRQMQNYSALLVVQIPASVVALTIAVEIVEWPLDDCWVGDQ